IDEAKRRDPQGDYRIGRAEQLAFPDGSFDLVVSYLSLIDIPDVTAAVAEMARVLRPGGSLLIANLTSFNTAAQRSFGARLGLRPAVDHYLVERAEWVSWRGIRIQNWHRPLSTYMALLLGAGLELRHYAEPSPYAGDSLRIAQYRRAPWFLIMEWRKPEA
ncbi:MAG: class I SAM-dependent methyltransferase, partial [Sphingomonas sp.]